MPEETNYAKNLVVLAERRSNEAAAWTPREALMAMLSDLDAGLEIERIVICYDGVKGSGFKNCTKSAIDAIGLLQVTQLAVYDAGRADKEW